MKKVSVTLANHDIFGRCVMIENGLLKLCVTIDFGPRIIHFSAGGMDNMFYEDHEMKPLAEPFPEHRGDAFKLYGGHRLWISPEVLPRCYHPDNEAVEWEETEYGARFTAAVEKNNGIQKILNINVSPDKPALAIEHTIMNRGAWDIALAPWALTVTDKGGKEVMPIPKKDTGLLPDKSLTLWPYTTMNDSRVYWGKDYITLTQNDKISDPFKFGYNNDTGWAAVFNKGQLFIKFFDSVDDGLYPDNGCSFETYTNGEMLEVETLGQMSLLPPGGGVAHTEEWEIYKEERVPSNDESEIAEIMSKYI